MVARWRVGETNMSATAQTLVGRRVLIVEDEALVALMLEIAGAYPWGRHAAVWRKRLKWLAQ